MYIYIYMYIYMQGLYDELYSFHTYSCLYIYLSICLSIYLIYIYIYIYMCIYIIPLHSCDYLKKNSIEINVTTDESNSRHEIEHRTNDEIGVAVQSWL